MNKEGKILMDRIRAVIKRMQDAELKLKEIRYDQVKTSSVLTPVLILTATFLSLLICMLAYWITKKEIKQRATLHNQLEQTNLELKATNQELIRAETHLKHLNSTLETRVEERTPYLSKAQEELRNVNQELFQKNKNLLRVNADLDNFIYTASHDLKAPITNIEGLITLLKEDNCYQDKEIKNVINKISSSGEKLNNVIEDLAVVVRIQNESDSTVEKINLGEIIQEVSLSIADLWQASQAQIKLKIAPQSELFFSKKIFAVFSLI